MNYLPRTIQPVIEEASKFFKIVMVSGMRQVGKSTLLKQLSSDKRTIISFDDINNLSNVFREDEVVESYDTKEILSNAPEQAEDHFLVRNRE